MPKFRFEFLEGVPKDAIFADMADRHEAVREAKCAAKEAMLDGIADGTNPTGWVAKICDEAGYLVATLGFQDMVAVSEKSQQPKKRTNLASCARAEARIAIHQGQSNSIQAGA
ncbi:hypothetical protein [Mesorhizobium sp. B2-1-3A]|uniref:DUF6894 family protein n=1 Tax=Mesorhizobium sp. B2-1-3A TaxID=2589971 RepID=UPI001FEFA923|nr:hypothetical protein [Mesorhizobium sp. B2-1-3A]